MNRTGIAVTTLSFLIFDFSSSVFSRVSTDICFRTFSISGIKEHSVLLTDSSVCEIAGKPQIRTEVIKEFSFFLFLRELITFSTEMTPSQNRGYVTFMLYIINFFIYIMH